MHLLLLPDGTQISSGADAACAIMRVELTSCVNEGEALSPGSAVAAFAEITLWDPEDRVALPTGAEITLFRDGVQLGIFSVEKPERTSANVRKLTAYDRMCRLDRDLTEWLSGLTRWPYTIQQLAQLVCQACGAELAPGALPNGDLPVHRFTGEVTGRQLIRWIGQATGRFCRARPDGRLEFAWYRENRELCIGASDPQTVIVEDGDLEFRADGIRGQAAEQCLTVEGEHMTVINDGDGRLELVIAGEVPTVRYYQGGLRYRESDIPQIQKVQIREEAEDVGTVFPDIGEAVHTYAITGNPLLSAHSPEGLLPVAQALYGILHGIRYTPCTVEIPESGGILPGDIVTVTDGAGKTFTAYIMNKKSNGRRAVLECTGSSGQNSPASNQTLRTLSGKLMRLRTDVDGLLAETEHRQETQDGLESRITRIQATAEAVSLQVKDLRERGTEKIVTGRRYTFDDGGLRIGDMGAENGVENKLDPTGMFVSSGGTMLLQADRYGVQAENLTSRRYLTVGTHARFEDYSDGYDSGRTACYYI